MAVLKYRDADGNFQTISVGGGTVSADTVANIISTNETVKNSISGVMAQDEIVQQAVNNALDTAAPENETFVSAVNTVLETKKDSGQLDDLLDYIDSLA